MTTTETKKLNYHFDQVGSYLRPENLKKAREQYAQGEIAHDDLLKFNMMKLKI